MFRGTPEEWEREWRFRERFTQIEGLLLRHRESLDVLLKENRDLKKENQRLLRTLGILRRERDKIREILVRLESRLLRMTEKGKNRGGEKEN